MKKIYLLLTTLVMLFGFTVSAHATLLNYEGFDYSNGASLAGLSGGTGWGSNAWTTVGISMGSMSISGGSLGYPLGTSLSPIGGKTVANGTETRKREFDGHFIDMGSTGTTYFSVLMRKTVDNGPFGDGFGFGFTKSGSTSATINFGIGANEGFFMSFGGNNFGPLSTLNDDYFFVGRIDANATGDDSVHIQVYAPGDTVDFVDPLTWTMEKFSDSSDVLTGIMLRSVFDTENAFYDEIRIGTTWDDVALGVVAAPIPEPATIALMGIGLAGLAGGAIRRRLKKMKQ